MRVLVVEDEVRMAALIKRGLEEDGYAVDVAADGTDAIWQAGEFDYDVVVLDVMLPGADGFEVCRRPTGASW
jgi:two-component system OmpR family response regulator